MNAGDTAWVLMSVALVLLMTPGLAFFYAGLVREANVLNTLKMSLIATCVIAVEWAVVGYSMVFAEGTSWLGGWSYIGLAGVGPEPDAVYGSTVPHLAFMAFQMMFAIITPALIAGAVVGRMRFSAYTLFVLLWSLVVYNPIAHWVWGPGGWIAALGALDFAGGTVVHVSAGVSALVAARVLGPRRRGNARTEEEQPHSVPLVVLGTALLWFGWFGFNAGSALAANGLAATAVVTTMLAAATAVLAWIGLDLMSRRKPRAVDACIAAVVGLVAITPAAGYVTPAASMAIGAVAAATSCLAIVLIRRTRLDDTLDVFACHGVGGVVGALLTGVFASTAANPAGVDGLLSGNFELLAVQALSVLATGAWAAVGTWVVLQVMSRFMALRTDDEFARRSAARTHHIEAAYLLESGLDGLIQDRLSTLIESPRS